MLSMFNKNVVFQYKLAMMLTETRELHLGKIRERSSHGKRGKQNSAGSIGEQHQLQHQQ